MNILVFLNDHTVQNVLIGAALLGISSGVLGCYTVLRQQSLLGDALSHAALPGVCLGFIVAGSRNLGAILTGALITGALAALFMLLLVRHSRIKTDAALGSALGIFFAVGVVLLTYIQGSNNASQGGLDSFLFGQAAAMLRSDLWIMGSITFVALLLVFLFWKELKLATFDPIFAGTIGLPIVAIEIFMTVLVAVAVVIGLQMVGVVLMAAMVIAPAVAARQWVNSLEGMVLLAAGMGAAGGVTGALLSATGRNLPTGPLIILSISAFVLVSLLIAPGRGIAWEQLRLLRNRRTLHSQRVLTTLYRLAEDHRDPRYLVEQGMLTTYHRANMARTLAQLEQSGFVARRPHMPDEGKHWALTDAGRREAERILSSLNPGQA